MCAGHRVAYNPSWPYDSYRVEQTHQIKPEAGGARAFLVPGAPSPRRAQQPEVRVADPEQPDAAPSFAECMAHASRLLLYAEGEIDLAKMDQYNELAQTWVNLASLHQDALT